MILDFVVAAEEEFVVPAESAPEHPAKINKNNRQHKLAVVSHPCSLPIKLLAMSLDPIDTLIGHDCSNRMHWIAGNCQHLMSATRKSAWHKLKIILRTIGPILVCDGNQWWLGRGHCEVLKWRIKRDGFVMLFTFARFMYDDAVAAVLQSSRANKLLSNRIGKGSYGRTFRVLMFG